MKTKPPNRSVRDNGWRIADRILRNNIEPEPDSLKLIFSKTLFEESLNKSDLIEQVVEGFARQHPADEWAASLPLKLTHDSELAGDIVHGIGDYMSRHLSHAYYCATLLIIYQAIFASFADEMPQPLMRELEEKIALMMRPKSSELRISDGRGAPQKWHKNKLEAAVHNAVMMIPKSQNPTLQKVAKMMSYELKDPLNGEALRKLIERHELKWRDLKKRT